MWLAAVALGLAAGTPSCELIVDTSTDQCSANTDCPGGAQCLDGVCVGGGCQTNAECAIQLGDEFSICRKADRKCVPLKSAQCTTIEGAYKDDNAFLFGSIHPTGVINPSNGAAAYGIPIENSIRLAVDEIMTATNGLPPAVGSSALRPYVMIGCDDDDSSDTAVLAARHLVDTVGVSAIIGGATSSITIELATVVTVPNSVLLISSSATSNDITNLADKAPGALAGAAGLLWRTSPADAAQAAALAGYINTPLIGTVRLAANLMPTDPIKITVLHRGDSYGGGLGTELETGLVFNGKPALDSANAPYYERINYGDPDDGDPLYNPGDAATKVTTAAPHIVVMLGFDETFTDLLIPIETGWPTGATHRPYYVFSDGGLLPELTDAVNTETNGMALDAWRKRISGSVPGTTNQRFATFTGAYKVRFGTATDPTVFGAAGAYDATYLLAFGLASLQGAPPTGPALAEGLRKMSMGDLFNSGKTSLAFQVLTGGGTIDFEGASGPLDFNPDTGEAPSDIQIWCLQRDGTKAGSGVSSGLFYNADTEQLEGKIDQTKCGLP